ncbi:4'-phosphopantetheinyl transferase superfamily protein [Kitasatospora sp. NBC_01287]|uniref:4'-phosphopantetheinyl transferase family protein n=1 Tax=Kitasatospora sp. NBC_01287 TaxID=2903573 RepID=UPI002255960A|nr:4'-phosphopantetheinyl transferase superfamily protein [Kitasatospora sp. NBC_01287]MCX4748886.1 4'-phosphopantetheinyl transferase superfamily protein [Kitasatospora sp. NBC_01287]
MSAAAGSALPLGPLRPRAVAGPDGPWDELERDMAVHGVGLAYGSITAWLAALPEEAELRTLLGLEWEKYQTRRGRRSAGGFLATRALLKHLAARAVGVPPRDLEFGYALTGRLYVRGCDQVDLNLSHTGDLMLVGLSTLGLIGVDVELIDRRLYGSGGEAQMCTPDETRLLAATPEAGRNERLVRQWTLKEAYTKALGQGMYFPFTEFGFQVDEEPPRLRRADGTPADRDAWSFRSLRVGERHLAGLALHDAGRGRISDTRAATTLDTRMLGAIQRALRVAGSAH